MPLGYLDHYSYSSSLIDITGTHVFMNMPSFPLKRLDPTAVSSADTKPRPTLADSEVSSLHTSTC